MKRRDGQRGFTTVEFALTIPLFFALMLGAIDGGRLVISRYMVSSAAVAAARVASVRSTVTLGPITTAANNAAPILTLAGVDVTFNASTTPVANDATFAASKPTGAGNTVTVTVRYSYAPLTGSFVGIGAKTLTGVSRVSIE